MNARRKIIRIPTHQTGKLELATANAEVARSGAEPALLPASAPSRMPMRDMAAVAVVNSSMVRGSFSSMISETDVDPVSPVRNVACPKSSVMTRYTDCPRRSGEYHGSSSPRRTSLSRTMPATYASNSSGVPNEATVAGSAASSVLTWTEIPCFSITSMLDPTTAMVMRTVARRTPDMAAALDAAYLASPMAGEGGGAC
ncbi:conserved hypothetical protein [Nitrosopumilaceae archaeon]|nr:conserved hypothetical protein [Nitrosopumilaceae archaeon]